MTCQIHCDKPQPRICRFCRAEVGDPVASVETQLTFRFVKRAERIVMEPPGPLVVALPTSKQGWAMAEREARRSRLDRGREMASARSADHHTGSKGR